MKKIICFLVGIIPLLLFSNSANAVVIEAGDWKFGINGFLDGEYTWMDESPAMVMGTNDGSCMSGTMEATGTKMGKMCEMSTINQSHMNLLVGAEKDKMRVNINFSSGNSFKIDHHGSTGSFEVEEAYGVYTFSEHFRLQVGNMLTPFGIYNQARYITPLFATVVLPQMYEMPHNYTLEEESIRTDMMPSNSNLMLFGNHSFSTAEVDYHLYLSSGSRSVGGDGSDDNKDKGAGGRIRITLADEYKLGASYYTVKDNKIVQGRQTSYGGDLELNFLEILKFEAEYVENNFDKRAVRFSYYGRLTAYLGSFSPFLSYDYAKDEANTIYKRGQARISTGSGYNLSDTTTMKMEYHYHKFHGQDMDKGMGHNLMLGTDEINMIRASLIFIF